MFAKNFKIETLSAHPSRQARQLTARLLLSEEKRIPAGALISIPVAGLQGAVHHASASAAIVLSITKHTRLHALAPGPYSQITAS